MRIYGLLVAFSLCFSSAAQADERFSQTKAGAQDGTSGLEWASLDLQKSKTWAEARAECQGMGEGWDLPTLDQLRGVGLVDLESDAEAALMKLPHYPLRALYNTSSYVIWAGPEKGAGIVSQSSYSGTIRVAADRSLTVDMSGLALCVRSAP